MCVFEPKKEQNSVRAFYRGYAITVIGMIPYAGKF